ncbi:MAG TPA: fasciclin domain-containing protein, partial [Spirosoma sp.]|nr:fasciclin domain-containing protein [Spirosoma sp.]
TGAVAPDSVKPSGNQRRSAKMTRADRKAMRQNAKRGTSGTATSQQEGQYRQSSAANGTAVNNSNSDNYNSNNVTNAPTGVGSNPSVTTNPTTLSGTATSGSSAASSGNSGSGTTSSTTSEPKTGTSRAVTGAPTTATPANVAGSTERNTNIHDFIASSPNYITLQNALQSADLDDLLKENEAYTLFAPLNTAFKKLPASMQAGLLEGRNREALKQLLSYHLVRGTLDANELSGRIKAGSGKVQLQTLAGGMLTAQMGANGRITITDEQGKSVAVESTQKVQSNGIVHGIDSVLMPKSGASSIR